MPLQDALGLDSAHRMNRPGTAAGNWEWRFRWDELTPDIGALLLGLARLYGRAPRAAAEAAAGDAQSLLPGAGPHAAEGAGDTR